MNVTPNMELAFAQADRDDARRERDQYYSLSHRLSRALLGVRPLGGSELFIKVGEEYFADPDFCGRAITALREALHSARQENVRLKRTSGES